LGAARGRVVVAGWKPRVALHSLPSSFSCSPPSLFASDPGWVESRAHGKLEFKSEIQKERAADLKRFAARLLIVSIVV
jgi:hypothetical protein